MLGKTLTHYEILEELNRGGMGVLYRARDVKLNREVAIKVLPAELTEDKDRKRRFTQEALATAALEHPHIAVIYETDEADGITFIAMELIRGETLADEMKQARIPATRALELGVEISEGLAHAHDKSILHRDLKPANVMVTQDGHAKIIDFGLAKALGGAPAMLGAAEGPDGEETAVRSETEAGAVLGTVSYMSPEQARGEKLDARSDVFSFGILLFQMLSGELPFQGASGIDVLHGILRDEAPKLNLDDVPGPSVSALDAIVSRCLKKSPDDRFQDMREVASALKDARLSLETGSTSIVSERVDAPPSWKPWAGAAVGLLVLVAMGTALFFGERDVAAPPSDTGKPTLAVLYFENLSGDPELDWLRSGLTDMLVTDLSQAQSIEVLGTDRLYQILRDMDELESESTSFDVVQELNERTGVDNVIVGSFAKAGNEIRLSARLQDARDARILSSESIQGSGDEAIFTMIDDLSLRILSNFESEEAAVAELDRDLTDVTTSSIEAYRHYADGIRLHERYREEEAIPHFEKAIELDPGFAMALVKLGVILGNLNRNEEAEAYGARALENVDRLTDRERYYIEGWVYAHRGESERAIESYAKGVELYPDHASARHNLANELQSLERFDEAIPHFEVLAERGHTFPQTYSSLANSYAATGELGKARDVLETFLAQNPDAWPALLTLSQIQLFESDFAGAMETIDTAVRMGAPSWQLSNAQTLSHIWSGEFAEAEANAAQGLESPDPFARFMAGQVLATTLLYHGRTREILERVIPDARATTAMLPPFARAENFEAYLWHESGDAKRALDVATRASEVPDPAVSFGGDVRVILATIELGDLARARVLFDELATKARSNTSRRAERWLKIAEAELLAAEGDREQAVSVLEEAEPLLSVHAFGSEHAEIWFRLGVLNHELGRTDEARAWFERMLDENTRFETIFSPIPYVRSFYYLGAIHEAEGRMDEALTHYRRFHEYWANGDLDRDLIAEVARKIG